MELSDRDYEDVYAETLLCLKDVHTVGLPYLSGGIRYCHIDGQSLADAAVFQLWWGEEIASRILDGR